MRILFSEKPLEWKAPITRGFAKTQHRIEFGKFAPERFGSFDLIVPLTMDDLRFLCTVRHLLPGNPIPIPDIASIRLCDDKIRMNESLRQNGFSDMVPKIGGDLGFPFILKTRSDEWGANSRIILDKEQHRAHQDKISNPDHFTQEFIKGQHEYATHILFKDRRIIFSVNIRYTFENDTPIKGRDQPLHTSICACPYLDRFTSILNLIGFEGLCCFNYKVSGGRAYFIEVNPRFGGSLSPYFFAFMPYLCREK